MKNRSTMNAIRVLGLVVLTVSFVCAKALAGEREMDLVRKAFSNLYSDNFVQVMRTETRGTGSRVVTRVVQMIRRQGLEDVDEKLLLRVVAPSGLRDTAILVAGRPGAGGSVFLFLPAFRVSRQLSGAQRSDLLFGTDLIFEDIEPKRSSDYVIAESEHNRMGDACVAVELRPKPALQSWYDLLRLCIDERGGIHSIEYFRQGVIVKRMLADLESMSKTGERVLMLEFSVESVASESITTVITESYQRLSAIPEHIFSRGNLSAGDARRDRSRLARYAVGEPLSYQRKQ